MGDAPISPEVFDRLRKATASNPAELAELYGEYLAEARRTLAELHTAVVQRRGEELRARAHYLKGSSQVVGATLVAQYCAALEEKAGDAEFSGTDVLVEQVVTALASVEEEVSRRLGKVALPSAGSAA